MIFLKSKFNKSVPELQRSIEIKEHFPLAFLLPYPYHQRRSRVEFDVGMLWIILATGNTNFEIRPLLPQSPQPVCVPNLCNSSQDTIFQRVVDINNRLITFEHNLFIIRIALHLWKKMLITPFCVLITFYNLVNL